MSEMTFYAPTDDETLGNGASDSADTLFARFVNDSVDLWSTAHIYFNVFDESTGLPSGATINSATFWWYNYDYSTVGSKPATTETGLLKIWDEDSSTWVTVYEMVDPPGYAGDGWQSQALSQAAYEAIGGGTFNASSPLDTEFRFEVQDPGEGRHRIWQIVSADNTNIGSSPNYAKAYLVVDYTEAGSSTVKTAVIWME